MIRMILFTIFESMYLGTTLGFIYMVSLVFQKIIFLEYHEPKQEKLIKKIVLFSCIALSILDFASYLLFRTTQIDLSDIWLVVIIILFLVLFIYNSFTGRKRARWLAFLEFIPMSGYYFATIDLFELPFLGDVDYIISNAVYMVFYWIVIATFLVLEKKQPKFVVNLEKDLKNRSLSVGEELVVWGIGIWLLISDILLDEIIAPNATPFICTYINILNALVAVLVIVFVISSNYRAYYNKKNMELQDSLVDAMDELEKQSLSTLMALTRAIEAKDRYTKGHSSRVAKYSRMIAARMGKTENEQEKIYHVALLHDVGKLRVPEEIINKEGKLTDEEFGYIKLHPVAGYNILRDIHGEDDLSIGAKFHHERYDGKGYPNGLAGENIPEIARIIAVADSYDAMASNRSYRKALPQEVIKGELEKGMGTQFDPEIAKVMIEIMNEDKEYDLKEKDKREKTILIVDDSNINLMLAENILKTEPIYHVLKATSGEEAVSIVSEKVDEVDLMLLDIEMPGMDGFETLKKIRELSQLPVIFMTADKELSTIEHANAVGVKDYITKPFSGPGLLESIYGVLQSEKGI